MTPPPTPTPGTIPPGAAPALVPLTARILVVDDVLKNLQVVGTMLRQAGYEVMPASGGAQALERVRVQAPDLILLDLMMPDMDGLEVCRRLKDEPATRSIPVIFLTASNEMEHLVRGFEVGAVDYITKPFNPPELLARVRTHVELCRARERLRELNDEKNEFMGVVAHDLRSPLGAITGYAEMVVEEMDALDPVVPEPARPGISEARDCARRIGETSRRMVAMVQNLLDANRIERGEVNFHPLPTPLTPLVGSVVDSLRPRSTAKNQALTVDTDPDLPPARVDPSACIQVFENLVSNAIKYSPPGGAIRVRLRHTEGQLRFEVHDQGPGLSAEDRKRLFGKFARLSAKPTGGESSTGLGLSIVKRIVEALQGRVWCESEPGRGSTFLVTFPAAPP